MLLITFGHAMKFRFIILAGRSATLRVFMEKNPQKISKKTFQKNISKKYFQNLKKNMPKLLRM
jgi:hypothetical protein